MNERRKGGLGDIDLISLFENKINLIELKIMRNKKEESILKAILEIYTYFKILMPSEKCFKNSYDILKDLKEPEYQLIILFEENSFIDENIKNIKNLENTQNFIKKIQEEINIDFYSFKYQNRNIKYNERDSKGKYKLLLDGEVNFIRKEII